MVWDLVQDEFANFLCGEGLHAVASITSSDKSGYIARESWPPVVACDELQGFPTAWVVSESVPGRSPAIGEPGWTLGTGYLCRVRPLSLAREEGIYRVLTFVGLDL